MKPQRAFVAERALAQHCSELLGGGVPSADELLGRFSQTGERFAKAFTQDLVPLTVGEAPVLEVASAHLDDVLLSASGMEALAANSLFHIGEQAVPLVLSFDARAVLCMVDRTFGGRGLAPEVMPQRLPLSAELMAARLEQASAARLADVLGLAGDDAVQLLRRDGSFTALAAFPKDTPLAVLRIDVTEQGREAWPLFIITPEAALPVLFAENAAAPKRIKGRADPASEPFASLPLELTAVLVDMRVSMATMAALEPGKVIPVSVARNVPLKIDGRVIATGSVGEADDSIAIRITQAFA